MSVEQRGRWPGGEGTPWPGAWTWGDDHSGGSDRVIAVHSGEYPSWIGPVDLTQPGQIEKLYRWGAIHAEGSGGYVRLFPADGDAAAELDDALADYDDDDEDEPLTG